MFWFCQDGTESHEASANSKQQRISHGALPRHPDGARRWTTPKQARRARVHAPERNDTERPTKFTKQRHPPRCLEAGADSRNDGLTMERCNASGRNQTRVMHQIRHHDPCVSKPHPQSSEQRPASRCHEARPARMPKRMGEAALPNQTPVFERHPT
jgi:hypothetical protein